MADYPPMLELANVFQCFRPAYRERFGADLLPSQRRSMDESSHCHSVG
ncbi:MAG TPA: hypothetical protein VLK82_12005 [Candidatus Tectomicrobia bacterium]|nr:hypothetical protein [Candidatus Tectomicrobia bacterium]